MQYLKDKIIFAELLYTVLSFITDLVLMPAVVINTVIFEPGGPDGINWVIENLPLTAVNNALPDNESLLLVSVVILRVLVLSVLTMLPYVSNKKISITSV